MDRRWLKNRRIAVGVGGGIAAYKACDLVRELRRAGASVRVAMTPAAQQFVTVLTFQSLSGNSVLSDYFDPNQEEKFGHLSLARWADAYVIAPATADLIARIRAGMANDAVTTSLVAFRGPVLLAPAMNVAMWENPGTQENLAALLADSRFAVVGPGVGLLADGDVGAGRLAELADIVDATAALGALGALAGKRVLVTAGPTREAIDPVRFISNPSTGKMGLAIAEVARARGAEVTVVLGPVGDVDREGFEVVDVIAAEDMRREVLSRVTDVDVFVATAAVVDFRPMHVASKKIKKAQAPEALVLERTPDVLLEASQLLAGSARRPLLVGFAAETNDVLAFAEKKLAEKNLDLIVANDVTAAGAGFGANTNAVTVLGRRGERFDLNGTKHDVARGIWDAVAPLLR